MADKVKKGDHVEIVYVAREKQSGMIFDLNDAEVAKKEGLKGDYNPTIVCVGQKDVLEGLDDALEGKEVGKSFTVDVPPEKAFGPKDSSLYQLVSMAKFKEGRPYPGMQVNVNNRYGVVKTVSGGRVMIDFNHPLAGRNITYEAKVTRIVKDDKEKVSSFIKMYLNQEPEVEVKDAAAMIKMDVPEKFQEEIIKKIKERVPSLKKVEFKALSEEKPKSPEKKE